jgi:hypothetical protein
VDDDAELLMIKQQGAGKSHQSKKETKQSGGEEKAPGARGGV